MKKETVPYLKRSFTMLMVLWTFTIVLIFYLSFISEKKTVFNLAAHQSRASFDKDIQYRLWATRHGGVYVPQTENTPPNPDLANIPERDITTPSGRKLTLMNPAYMTRQVFEISKERFGYIGHITSLNPLRKENAADEWEKRSLTSFARGVKEVIEITDFNGEPHVRFMAPFITEKGCLKCHESQGYKVGDIRGGISISFPLQPFDEMFWSNMQGNILSLIGIWLTGMGGLFFAFKKMQVTIAEKEQLNEEVKNNERMLNSLLNGIKESALLIDVKGKVLAANDTVDDRINNGHRDIVGKNVYDLLDSDVAKARQKYVEELIRTGKALQFEDVRNNRVISNSISPVLESNGIISKIALIGYDITDQRKNALALMETEERFTLAMKASNDGLFDWNLLTNEIYYSPRWKSILGYEDHELPNDFSVWETNTDHEDVQRSWKLQQKLISRQIDRFVMEFKMKHKDGNWVDILSRAEAIFDETGKAVRIIGTHTDITERKLAEEELRIHKELLSETESIGKVGGWSFNIDTMELKWTDEVYRIHEVEISANPSVDAGINYYTEESKPIIDKAVRRAIEYGENYDLELEIITAKGNTRAVHTIGKADLMNRRIYGFFQDITERKRAEKILQQAEQRLQLANKATNDVIWDWDVVTDMQQWNEAGTVVFGWTEIVERPVNAEWWVQRVHTDDRQRVHDSFFTVLHNPLSDVWHDEYRFLKADGTYADVLDRGYVLRNEQGNAIRMVGAMLDITERKRAEEKLQEREANLRSIVENSPVGYYAYTLESDNRLVFSMFNPSADKILHISHQQFIGKDILDAFPALAGTGVSEMYIAIAKGELQTQNFEVPYNDKGINGTFEVRAFQGLSGQVIVNFTDITERKLAEIELEKHRNHLEELVKVRTKELEQANESLKKVVDKEKELNELKSRFLSTTSHEFRTPLTSILSSTELLQRFGIKWSDEKKEEHYNRIIASVEYLTKLLDDILTLNRAESGKISYQPETVNLHDLSQECLIDAKLLMNDIHEPMFNYTSRKKEFQLDPKLMKFVLNNLLSNAAKYSPQGGKVELNISTDKKHILIEVIDEGIGIPPEDIQKIYDAFYRTKTANEIAGTGLGLAIVKRAVDLHGGEIKVESKLGEGTRFLVQIPILESK
jgi:PAS domain S-box-containing protein